MYVSMYIYIMYNEIHLENEIPPQNMCMHSSYLHSFLMFIGLYRLVSVALVRIYIYLVCVSV